MNKSCINLVFLALFFMGVSNVTSQSKYTDNQSINSLLKKKRNYNKKNKTIYKIQLYNGTERRARNIKQNFMMKFPGVPKLEYEAPEWKVQVGGYTTKLEADRALNKIKEKFSGAIVIPYSK
ncbi:SPOR domain-containing protein [Tenacibaculum sp. MEBiC06402]|uniref:SPOR domain-containing protein n=1 Tax=unclassified Tenacibaculum TaxID=2635139 RepID=UPI003B9B3EF9